MFSYKPADEFAKVVRDELISTLPFFVRMSLKVIPDRAKDFAIVTALTQVIPLSFSAIASTKNEGQKVALTSCGDMEERVKGGFLRRIAIWFVASEMANVSIALHKEVMRLGREEYDEGSWRLSVENEEVVLHVLSTSLLKVSSDTVADIFIDSFQSLKSAKGRILELVKKK